MFVRIQFDLIAAGLFNLLCHFAVEHGALVENDLTGKRIDGRLCKLETGNASAECKLFVELIAADGRNIVSLGVEEQVIDKNLSRFDDGRVARTQLLVDFLQSFVMCAGAVLLGFAFHQILGEGGFDIGVVAEGVKKLLRCAKPQSTKKNGDRQFAVFIDSYIENIVGIGFIFEPCAAVRIISCRSCRQPTHNKCPANGRSAKRRHVPHR